MEEQNRFASIVEQADKSGFVGFKSQFIEMFGDTHVKSDNSRQWKEVVEIINGKDYKTIQVEDGGYPVYGTGGEMARAADYLSPANSILLGRKGTIDKPLLIKEKYWNVDTAFGAVPDENILNYVYFYWHCKTIDFNILNKGTTLPSTTKVDLLNLWVKIPAMEEQNRFASIVEQADKSGFVGFKSQFIEMFGIAEATKPLADFVEVSFPGEWGQEDKDGSGVKVIRTTNFTNNGKLDLSEVVTRDIDSAKIEKKKLFKGDIILERSGGTNDNPVGRVVYFEEDGVYLFNNFTQLLRCKEGVNSLFIFYSLFNYYQMNKNVIRSMGNKTTGIQNLKMDRYWQIPIADVSIELQKEFESIYRQADKSGFVGFKSQFVEMFDNPLSQVQRYPLEKLGDCCVLNPRRPSISLSDTDMVSFVPMPCVSENGYLQDVADEEYGKVKKGFTYFENKDVLFAKITPCMENGKGAIAQELTNGIGMGSTEFHVLRPIEGKSNSYWLLALTRMPIFREQASKNMSGTGGQKRVGASFLDNFMVGLPPVEEQNRFERIYRQADKSGYYN